MGLGVSRRVKKLAAAFALAGIAFYSLLLPWHLTSQFAAKLFEAEFGSAGAVICSSTEAVGTPSTPGAPSTSCPICKGLASYHLAVEPAKPSALPHFVFGETLTVWLREDAAGARLLTPRSRGPPAQA